MAEDYPDDPQRIQSDIGQWAMVPAWVRQGLRSDAGKVDVMALAVFAVLAEKADRGGVREDFRSVKTIAEELGVDPGTVRRSLQHLKQIGAVDWTQRVRADGSNSTNDYQVFFADPARVGACTPARERAHHNDRALVRDGPAREDARISQTSSIQTSSQLSGEAKKASMKLTAKFLRQTRTELHQPHWAKVIPMPDTGVQSAGTMAI